EPLPEPGSWGISLRSAQLRSSTGSRYTLTVSTGTSTNVIGEKHLAATVTVRVGPRSASLNTATPRESANVTSLLSSPSSRMTAAPATGLPVTSSRTVTVMRRSSGCPLKPPRKPLSLSPYTKASSTSVSTSSCVITRTFLEPGDPAGVLQVNSSSLCTVISSQGTKSMSTSVSSSHCVPEPCNVISVPPLVGPLLGSRYTAS